MPALSSSTGLTITDPIVAYRTLLALKQIRPDPAQHRLALQLQKLYYRLKDYNPELEYRHRLDQITRAVQEASELNKNGTKQRRASGSRLSSLWNGSSGVPVLALTRTTSMQDSAKSIQSPQGMLLYGEVGRGKSMLLDLLADSLPSRKKKRWHFNTFMLEIFRHLEQLRTQRLRLPAHLQGLDQEHSVLSLAKDTVSTSPILFLDEFQMPDRAASKLLNNFMTSFFHLGGVLIATSNRMPEELAKAAGVEFASAPQGSFKGLLGWKGRQNEGQKAATTDFGAFVEVLRARCEVWEMEGERDWRREDGQSLTDQTAEDHDDEETSIDMSTISTSSTDTTTSLSSSTQSSQSPPHFHILFPPSSPDAPTSDTLWLSDIASLTSTSAQDWTPATLTVYGRSIAVPFTSLSPQGITMWPFARLCGANLGPADYISLASTYHTLILTDVPVLTLLQKNEARRFITLLDALYEAKCRLLIRAHAPPDGIFFPETRRKGGSSSSAGAEEEPTKTDDRGESVYQETFSEIYQDSTAPFRPNVSVYTDSSSSSPSQSQLSRSVLADEDADFGPTYGNGRWSGGGSSSDIGSTRSHHGSETLTTDLGIVMPGQQQQQQQGGPDFSKVIMLTGEDERFAYKRARSRLWEMCGSRWWGARENTAVNEWWRPVGIKARTWEVSGGAEAVVEEAVLMVAGSTGADGTNDDDRRGKGGGGGLPSRKPHSPFRHDDGASPFRTRADPPPSFGWQHAWGMVPWGRKAGEWGKGVEGDRRRSNKDRDRDMVRENENESENGNGRGTERGNGSKG